MFIDINKIGVKGLWLQDSVCLDEGQLIEEDSCFLDDLEYTVHFSREDEKIKAKGRIKTTLALRCVYCLENFEMKVDSKFDIILFPISKLDTAHNSAVSAEEMEYIFFDGEEIDLERILLEQVNLFLPFNPTCSSSCKGICPNCGINLNKNKCQCENSSKELSIVLDKIKR